MPSHISSVKPQTKRYKISRFQAPRLQTFSTSCRRRHKLMRRFVKPIQSPLISGVMTYSKLRLQFAAVIRKFSANLPSILAIVHQLAPKANIVLYNLYDPFSSQTAPALHALAEQMIAPENQIITEVATQAGLPAVDTHSLFENRQAYLVLPGDVHPTILGQAVLAIGGYGVLFKEECTKGLAFHLSQD
jgi:hypothetical protein